ncbi:hypothetical protein ACVFYP_22210 [Roseomonas sp. F4]
MSETDSNYVRVQSTADLPLADDPLDLEIYGGVPGTGEVKKTPTSAIRDASVDAAEVAARVAAEPVAREVGAEAALEAIAPPLEEANQAATDASASAAAAALSSLSVTAAITGGGIEIVAALPTTGVDTRLYLRYTDWDAYRWWTIRPAGVEGAGTAGYTFEGVWLPVLDRRQVQTDTKLLLSRQRGAGLYTSGALDGVMAVDALGGLLLGIDPTTGRVKGDVQAVRDLIARQARSGTGFSIWSGAGTIIPLFTDRAGNVLLGFDMVAEELVGAFPTGNSATRNIAPIYGPQLFGVTGQVLPLYIANLFPDRGDGTEAICTLSSQPDFPAAPLVLTGTGQLDIPVDRLGSAADLVIRRSASITRQRIALSVSKRTVPIVGTSSPKILMIGDSISNRAGAAHVNQHLTEWGFTPTWLGTINGTGFDQTDTLNEDGPLGECREGWAAYGDMLYATPEESDVNQVIAPGGEATYLGLSKTSRRRAQVFIRAATGGDDPSIVFNGYVFDFGFYLSRFSIATPDIVIINLWVNDVTEASAAGADQAYIGLSRMIDSIRGAAPSANIILWYSAIPRTTDSDAAWIDAYRAGQQAVVRVVRHKRATDSLVHLVSAGAHQSQEAGWTASFGSANADTGIQSMTITDYRHPVTVARRQQFLMVAAAVACLAP